MNLFWHEFKNGMKLFGDTLAAIVNSFLLLIVYIVGVGITSIVAKISNKHFLQKNLEEESYWDNLDINEKSIEECIESVQKEVTITGSIVVYASNILCNLSTPPVSLYALIIS